MPAPALPTARAGAWNGGQATSDAPWGLYVHVPFCPYKCHYCDFVAVGGGARVARWHVPYVDAIMREADHWERTLHPGCPHSVFYGGGTPTVLAADRLARLHASLVARFQVPATAEVSVECNPGTVTRTDLETLRRAGVNRLSMGLQAVQDDMLARLNRHHTFTEFLTAYRNARDAGFDNISVDLMYGLPGQTLRSWEEGLERVIDLGPEHVSAYSLQVEEGTLLHARAAAGSVSFPGEDLEALMYAACRARLAGAGYAQYEISNFARSGRRCRHNLLYWRNADYLGLGVGAHSHWRGWRWGNTNRLAVYCTAVAVCPLPGAEHAECGAVGAEHPPAFPGCGRPAWVHVVEAADARRERGEAAFLGLRLMAGIEESAYARRYGIALRQAFPGVVERLLAGGLLATTANGWLRLTADAVPVANRVFAEFV